MWTRHLADVSHPRRTGPHTPYTHHVAGHTRSRRIMSVMSRCGDRMPREPTSIVVRSDTRQIARLKIWFKAVVNYTLNNSGLGNAGPLAYVIYVYLYGARCPPGAGPRTIPFELFL